MHIFFQTYVSLRLNIVSENFEVVQFFNNVKRFPWALCLLHKAPYQFPQQSITRKLKKGNQKKVNLVGRSDNLSVHFRHLRYFTVFLKCTGTVPLGWSHLVVLETPEVQTVEVQSNGKWGEGES